MIMTHSFKTALETTLTSLVTAALLTTAACSPDRLVTSDPPSNIVMPSAVTSATSALAFYNGAAMVFNVAVGGGGPSRGNDNYVQNSGLMTDELTTGSFGSSASDQRNNALLYDGGTESAQATPYTRLQAARTATFQARQALQMYGAAGSGPLISRMYSLEAYTIVMLAEYFCNGVPLTETPLQGASQYSVGLTTTELYTRAGALFDTALTLAGDSSRFTNLAKVGKGRVLLDEGQFAAAASAVADVPLTYVYNAEFKSGLQFVVGGNGYSDENWLEFPYTGGTTVIATLDHEGGNGEVWSTDPRTTLAQSNTSPILYAPNKYPTGSTSIRLADGVEAQLIQAEASLNAGTGDWLTILNTLRASCTTASGCTAVPGITGGTTQLPPLVDSVTPAKRLKELMSERAHWLFLTGHRIGDMRRMLRAPYNTPPYSMTASTVYPSGAFVNPGYTGVVTAYGNDVVAIPARAEQLYNPKYTGCFDLNP